MISIYYGMLLLGLSSQTACIFNLTVLREYELRHALPIIKVKTTI